MKAINIAATRTKNIRKVGTKRNMSPKRITHLQNSIVRTKETISIIFERSVTKSATIALKKMSRIDLEKKYATYLKK